METLTEVSCFSSAGFTPLAVPSPLPADGWAEPLGAVADFGTFLGPPAASHCLQRCPTAGEPSEFQHPTTFLVPRHQRLGAK